MRRDIIAGCVGLGVTLLFFISNQYLPYNHKKIEYSPFMHKPEFSPTDDNTIRIHPASDLIHSTVVPKQKINNAYPIPETNRVDTTTLDELMQLPLESGGELVDEPREKNIFVKYVRFQFTELRDSVSVHLGGFRFLFMDEPIPFEKIQLWNPHTGYSTKYGGEAWSDSDQWMIIFSFSEPVQISHYELKSSNDLDDHDPIQWNVEGSMNGSFWFLLDDRTRTPTAFPKERNSVASYLMRT